MTKRETIETFIRIARILKLNLYTKPSSLVKFLLSGRKHCNGKSYYPELRSKSQFRIWLDQLEQILKYGYPNEFYFSYGFDVKSRKEMAEYMHYGPFSILRHKLNETPESELIVLRDKFLFGMLTQYLGVSTPENIGISEEGGIYDTRTKKVVGTTDFLKSLVDDDLFVKPFDGQCGTGIFHLKVQDGKFYVNDQSMDLGDLVKILEANRYLMQRTVKQNPVIANLHPQSLNTIRLVTVRHRRTGKIDVFPSILRIGTGGAIVDNTSKGGLAVGIDLNSGRLKENGLFKPSYGTRVTMHPDSNIRFRDVIIPYFDECKRQAIRLHSMLPHLHSIGWDIAIGPDGPVFVEGNDRWEITGPQNCNGGIKKLLLEYSE